MLEDFSEFPVGKSLLHNLKGWCPSQEMNESITSDTGDQSSEPYLNSTNTGGPQSGKKVNFITTILCGSVMTFHTFHLIVDSFEFLESH